MSEEQDLLGEAWRTLARFEERSVDLARLPDLPEVREEADVAAWQAAGHLRSTLGEVERLRGLLGRLQWAGTHCERDREYAACPVCDVLADSPAIGQQPHEPGCWLAAELHPGQHEAPRP